MNDTGTGASGAPNAADTTPREIRSVSIAGLGAAVPARALTNLDLEAMVDTSDEWIRTRTGIRERRIAEPGTPTSDLAAEAARKALARAGVEACDVDLIVLATFSPDCPYPATACAVQQKIGATAAAAFDIQAMCSGFVYGLAVGTQCGRTGAADRGLVSGAEVLSSLVDYEDRTTCILFGDGAGAAVLVPGDGGPPILHTEMGSDGSGFELLWQPAGGSCRPASLDTVRAREHFLRMDGGSIYKIAVRKFRDGIRRAAAAAGWEVDEVDLVVPHQVNTRILAAVVARLGIAPEKVYQNLARVGNTSAASIPLALAEADESGLLAPGAKVVLAAVGGGITWGSAAIRW